MLYFNTTQFSAFWFSVARITGKPVYASQKHLVFNEKNRVKTNATSVPNPRETNKLKSNTDVWKRKPAYTWRETSRARCKRYEIQTFLSITFANRKCKCGKRRNNRRFLRYFLALTMYCGRFGSMAPYNCSHSVRRKVDFSLRKE